MMKMYFIRTFATEDKPEMVCSYEYSQWKELCKEFSESGIKFTAWVETV